MHTARWGTALTQREEASMDGGEPLEGLEWCPFHKVRTIALKTVTQGHHRSPNGRESPAKMQKCFGHSITNVF